MVMSDLMVMSKSWQKLSAGDMVASVAKYHTPCLAGYYNKAAKLHKKDMLPMIWYVIAKPLLSWFTILRMSVQMKKLSLSLVLNKLYSCRLDQLSQEQTSRFNSTHLKNMVRVSDYLCPGKSTSRTHLLGSLSCQ